MSETGERSPKKWRLRIVTAAGPIVVPVPADASVADACAAVEARLRGSGQLGKRRIRTLLVELGELGESDSIADAVEDGEELRPVFEDADAEVGPDERAGGQGAGSGEELRPVFEQAGAEGGPDERAGGQGAGPGEELRPVDEVYTTLGPEDDRDMVFTGTKLEVTVCRARNLPNVDGRWKLSAARGCDAFLILEYKTQKHKSTVIRNTLEPNWDQTPSLVTRLGVWVMGAWFQTLLMALVHLRLVADGVEQNTFEFDLSQGELTDLKITIMDYNDLTHDENLGTAVITVDKLKALMAGRPAPKLYKFDISDPDGAALIGQSQQQTFVVLKLNAKEAKAQQLSLAECMLMVQAVVVVLLMCLWLLSQWFEFFDLTVAFTLLLFGVLTVAFMSWNLVVRSGEAKRGCQCLLVPKPGEPAYIRSFFIIVLCLVVLVGLVVVGRKLALEATPSPMSNSAHVSRVLETCSAMQSVQNKLDPCWEAMTAALHQQQQKQPADESSKEDEANQAQAQAEQMRKQEQEEQRKAAEEKKRKEEEQKRKEEEERKEQGRRRKELEEQFQFFDKEMEAKRAAKRRQEQEQQQTAAHLSQSDEAKVRAQSCETFDVYQCDMDYPDLFSQCRGKQADCDAGWDTHKPRPGWAPDLR
jgi:outer membrane biosynthesis protein TonB